MDGKVSVVSVFIICLPPLSSSILVYPLLTPLQGSSTSIKRRLQISLLDPPGLLYFLVKPLLLVVHFTKSKNDFL
ncbi:hypothetical protein N7508_004209 [Penicillium antarcticum]|uniref:uncharacterized protein n=1 Tax=Penicillium antarcticum TaxID=416450 RepID=UPI00239508D6|nr:uncharacterized protein N7508_004209 [Penicillium antarcticum]KAJ5308830.1 hypothetical protein N7508_004209 [Penicillium antarcticum]